MQGIVGQFIQAVTIKKLVVALDRVIRK